MPSHALRRLLLSRCVAQSMDHGISQRPRLHELPEPALANMLKYLDIPDHAALACTCNQLYRLVHGAKQTGASIVSRCYPTRDVCGETTADAPQMYFRDVLRVVSSPMARLVSDTVSTERVCKTHRFRAVFQLCGPSNEPLAQAYSHQDLDPATCLPWPLEGEDWKLSPWLCWPGSDHQGDMSPTRKRYR